MTKGGTISCCTWALEGPVNETLVQLAEIGLASVDVRPSTLREAEARALVRNLGLEVGCVALSHEMPEGATLDSVEAGPVEAAMAHLFAGLDQAANLGASHAYVVPDAPVDGDSLERCAAVLPGLADYARAAGARLCVEHFPGTALPTVAATLDFLDRLGHDNLYLLFDIGHAQMSGEDPAEVLPAAGPRLGYVHLDDNDGAGDLHLALTDGVQTRESLASLFETLDRVGYDGPVSLEMSPNLPDVPDAIRRGFDLVAGLRS